jgi:flavin-dependent dehydrogenase
VVEPFTGEGIFYALRSGELAAGAAKEMIRGNAAKAVRDYAAQYAAIYRGRLWVNALARSAVVSPKLGSTLFKFARFHPALRLLTRKIVR